MYIYIYYIEIGHRPDFCRGILHPVFENTEKRRVIKRRHQGRSRAWTWSLGGICMDLANQPWMELCQPHNLHSGHWCPDLSISWCPDLRWRRQKSAQEVTRRKDPMHRAWMSPYPFGSSHSGSSHSGWSLLAQGRFSSNHTWLCG